MVLSYQVFLFHEVHFKFKIFRYFWKTFIERIHCPVPNLLFSRDLPLAIPFAKYLLFWLGKFRIQNTNISQNIQKRFIILSVSISAIFCFKSLPQEVQSLSFISSNLKCLKPKHLTKFHWLFCFVYK